MSNCFIHFIKQLKEYGIASSFEINGCEYKEIEELESHFSVDFPITYKEFLKHLGSGAGNLFKGTDRFYDQLFHLRSWAEDLLKQNEERFELPANAFVFSMHQGYEFLYFLTTNGDENPCIYQYVEGQGAPTCTWNSFTDFIEASILQYKKG